MITADLPIATFWVPSRAGSVDVFSKTNGENALEGTPESENIFDLGLFAMNEYNILTLDSSVNQLETDTE